MIKSNKNILVAIGLSVLIILVLLLVSLTSGPNYPLNVPNLTDISRIDFNKKDELRLSVVNNEDNISEIINSLNGLKRAIGKESVNEVPYYEEYIKITIYDKESTSTIIYVYEKNGKYYVEQPYLGIYKITEDGYKNIVKYST